MRKFGPLGLGLLLISLTACTKSEPTTVEIYDALTCVRDTDSWEKGRSEQDVTRIRNCKRSQSVHRTRELLSGGHDIERMKQKLIAAAEDGSVSKLSGLIADGANVNWMACEGNAGSALDRAALGQHPEAVQYLLEQNAAGASGTALLAKLPTVFDDKLTDEQSRIQALLAAAPAHPPNPCLAAPVSGVVMSGDVEIAYEVQGVGTQPLVFLHDWSCDRRCLQQLAEDLAGEYRLVLFDFAGYGESKGTSKGVAHLVQQTHAVLTELDLNNAILLGHGLGAAVATEYATQHRERVDGLVLLGLPRGTKQSFDQVRGALADADPTSKLLTYLRARNGLDGGPQLLQTPLRTITSLPSADLISLLGQFEAYDTSARLKATDVSISCIDFDEGRDYGGENPKGAIELHGCLTQPLKNSGFYMMLESPPAMLYYTSEALRLVRQ